MANLVEGIQKECHRCRELLVEYGKIGPAGVFGALVINQAIENGEKAIASGDVVQCIAAYKDLQSCE